MAGAFGVSIGMPVGFDTVLGIATAARAQRARLLHRRQRGRHSFGILRQGGHEAAFVRPHRPDGSGRTRRAVCALKVVMGDTATSVNQGGASGSTGIVVTPSLFRTGNFFRPPSVACFGPGPAVIGADSQVSRRFVNRLSVTEHWGGARGKRQVCVISATLTAPIKLR